MIITHSLSLSLSLSLSIYIYIEFDTNIEFGFKVLTYPIKSMINTKNIIIVFIFTLMKSIFGINNENKIYYFIALK